MVTQAEYDQLVKKEEESCRPVLYGALMTGAGVICLVGAGVSMGYGFASIPSGACCGGGACSGCGCNCTSACCTDFCASLVITGIFEAVVGIASLGGIEQIIRNVPAYRTNRDARRAADNVFSQEAASKALTQRIASRYQDFANELTPLVQPVVANTPSHPSILAITGLFRDSVRNIPTTMTSGPVTPPTVVMS